LEKLRETLRVAKERAILVGVRDRHCPRDAEFNLAELAALARTAGAVVVDTFGQKIHAVNPTTYIGSGKAALLAQRVKKYKADVVIFDNDLSPRQIRELEKILNVKVLDRSELILDIFASRAKTTQARLQVELAQLEYTYPRLARMWSHLDSVAGAGGATAAGAVGGIGTRGPGEKQIEIDRRLVKKRITDLKRELAKIDRRKVRQIHARKDLFKVCLVGYTNAGKSTLLNALTGADAFVEDRLFATLDTRTRKWTLHRRFRNGPRTNKHAGGPQVLLSDTIGFVRDLPHQLVASFKATLEEAVNADLLVHVVDAANPDALEQIESVNKVLAEIGCSDHPTLLALNKVDIARKTGQLDVLETVFPQALCISAKTGFGIDALTAAVMERYKGAEVHLLVSTTQSDGRIQGFLRACGIILDEKYCDGMVLIDARLGRNQLAQLHKLSPASVEIVRV